MYDMQHHLCDCLAILSLRTRSALLLLLLLLGLGRAAICSHSDAAIADTATAATTAATAAATAATATAAITTRTAFALFRALAVVGAAPGFVHSFVRGLCATYARASPCTNRIAQSKRRTLLCFYFVRLFIFQLLLCV